MGDIEQQVTSLEIYLKENLEDEDLVEKLTIALEKTLFLFRDIDC